MNRHEYLQHFHCSNKHRDAVRDILEQWKLDNCLTGNYVIHHRDDTEETRKYNSEHYELWGFNEDGTFEYGKYVVFLTNTEHSAYHSTGEKNPMYGTHRSGEESPRYGKRHSEETKQKMRDNHADFSGENNPMYGVHLIVSDATRAKMSASRMGHPVSDSQRQRMRELTAKIKDAYIQYKSDGGTLPWNSFRHEVKLGNIVI